MTQDGWFGRGFSPGQYQPPADVGGPQDIYNRGRFFLLKDTEKKVLFIENLSDGFKLVEHRLWDRRRNVPWFFPCIHVADESKPCYFCEQKAAAYRMLFITCIDRYGYVPKKGPNAGNQITNVKRIFPIFYKAIGIFIAREKKVGGFKFMEFDILRGDSKNMLGDEYTPRMVDGRVVRYTEQELSRERIDIKPFDWEKVIPFNVTYKQQKQWVEEHPGVTWEGREESHEEAMEKEPVGTTEEPTGSDEPPF
jgi:hypothetical protein